MVLEQLLWAPGGISTLQDNHVALVENVYEAAILQLRLFYKGPRDEIFLDMFEDEYHNEMVRWFIVCTFLLSGLLHAVCRVWRYVCSICCRKAPCCCHLQTHLLLALSSPDGYRVERQRERGRCVH